MQLCLPDAMTTESPSHPQWKTYAQTKNKADVLRFLEGDGWEIKKQKFYNHCSSGKLTKNRNGFYTKRLVKKYAETWLIRTQSGQTVASESEDLFATKTREEIKKLKVGRKKEELKYDIERGKYILRSDLDAELASRLVVLANSLTHLIQSETPEMIAIVGGDQQKTADLIVFLTDQTDELLNELATMGRFSVHFAPEQESGVDPT